MPSRCLRQSVGFVTNCHALTRKYVMVFKTISRCISSTDTHNDDPFVHQCSRASSKQFPNALVQRPLVEEELLLHPVMVDELLVTGRLEYRTRAQKEHQCPVGLHGWVECGEESGSGLWKF